MRDNETLLSGLQAKIAGAKGKLLWRSLDELADTDEFKEWVEDEFPNRADLLNIDRRQFLKYSGAALAMAGLTGCRILPQTKAVPFVRSPEDLVAGVRLSYASALTRNGYALGVLVSQYEGRPIKIEGNPKHPASLGGTDVWEQAELLNMYDPDRSQSVFKDGESEGWEEFVDVVRKARATWANGGLRILTGAITSPTLTAQINSVIAKFPGTVWHAFEAINRDSVYLGTETAFGAPLNPVYNLKAAKVVVSLDADLFKTLPGNVRYARDFADGRRVRGEDGGSMNRLYVIESSTTITGAAADHRFPVKPSEIESVARALFETVQNGSTTTAHPVKWLDALVADLKANNGAAVVAAGDDATPAVHAYVAAINAAIGANDKTITYTKPIETSPLKHVESITNLVTAMNDGKVDTLLILGANPIYDAPSDLNFDKALKRVKLTIQHALYQDETTDAVQWHIPATHALETWSDARAFDGTTSLVQPLIAPLYDGNKSTHELLAELIDEPLSNYEILQNAWRPNGGTDFERWWQQTLIDGVVPDSAEKPVAVTLNAAAVAALPAPTPSQGLELNFRPDPTIWDGRYANNSWLQELPKPITTVTWDNVIIVSPATASKIGATPTDGSSEAMNAARISGKSVVELKAANGKTVLLPVWILPGHPNDTLTVTLGFGRRKAGRIGDDIGGDVYPLRTSQTMSFDTKVSGARVTEQGTGDVVNMIGDRTVGNSVDWQGNYRVASAQAQHLMRGVDIGEDHDRDIVRVSSFDNFVAKKGDIGPEEFSEPKPNVPQYTKATVPEDPGKDSTADDGFPVYGFKGRDIWQYKDRDPADKTITNPEGIVSVYPEFSKEGYNAWAMSIDLTTCIGCNACTIACQAENNIPTVGKEQVGRGRQMHWIRVDSYFSTNASDPVGLKQPEEVETYFQPVPCMHCEKAPCEPVCPVAATIHSHEGLNQMVYNRCVGTRYCSNNCPYKVRRFNFLKWSAGWGGKGTLNFFDLPVLKLATNPDVTVRGRGVMEKCSYCVQRINAARITAKKDQREIQDGEVVTACQQACPTNAIIFGDLNNPNSRLTQLKRQPHDYALLGDLGTRPRTTYLAKIKNPNPSIAGAAGDQKAAG